MIMPKFFIGELPVSFIKVVEGQVVLMFRPRTGEHIEIWEQIVKALGDRLKEISRENGEVSLWTSFAGTVEAIQFFAGLFRMCMISRDELRIVA